MKFSAILASAAAIASVSAYFYDEEDGYGAGIYARDLDGLDAADAYEMGFHHARSLFEGDSDDDFYSILGAREWTTTNALAQKATLTQKHNVQMAALPRVQAKADRANAQKATAEKHDYALHEGTAGQYGKIVSNANRKQSALDSLNNHIQTSRGRITDVNRQLRTANVLTTPSIDGRPGLPLEIAEHVMSYNHH